MKRAHIELFCAVLLLSGCRAAEAEPAALASARATSVPSLPVPAPPAPANAAALPPQAQPAPELSPAAWVELVADKQTARSTIEEVTARFRRVGPLQRNEFAPDHLSLRHKSAAHDLEISYARETDWKFSALSLQLAPQSAETLRGVYDALNAAIRQRLGKPIEEYKREGHFSQLVYRVERKTMLSVNQAQGEVGQVISLELGEMSQSD